MAGAFLFDMKLQEQTQAPTLTPLYEAARSAFAQLNERDLEEFRDLRSRPMLGLAVALFAQLSVDSPIAAQQLMRELEPRLPPARPVSGSSTEAAKRILERYGLRLKSPTYY